MKRVLCLKYKDGRIEHYKNCKTLQAAQKTLSKRNHAALRSAHWFNGQGVKEHLSLKKINTGTY